MIPQIILIALWIVALGLNIHSHGKTSDKPKNAIHSLVALLINLFLLIWGGFFDPIFEALK